MRIEAIIIIILVGGLLILTFYVIGIYNRLVDVRNRTMIQFEQIDFGLNQVIELVPDLIAIVKGFAKHEEKILNEVKAANEKMINARSINGKIKAAEELGIVLNKLFMLSDSYPELKKNVKFLAIKRELIEVQDRINYASSFYNDAVQAYNVLREQFPMNIVANIFKFKSINVFPANGNINLV